MLSSRDLVTALKAAAEPTRLRILALLALGELNVKDLTRILGQSQPRISRHLKLLAEAGLVERAREGSWVYFRLPEAAPVLETKSMGDTPPWAPEAATGGQMIHRLLDVMDQDDPVLLRDRQRAEAVRREREESAQAYFQSQAADWDRIRALHVEEAKVERAMVDALGDGPFDLLVDLGTGTGRTLELFSGHYRRGLGLDLNHEMLAYARAKLDRAGIHHAQVRLGDVYSVALPDACADAVVIHQMLHFLSDPARAVAEAARLVAPGGRLLVVDFAPHELEFLRENYAHERLGFARATISQWLEEAGLDVVETHDLAPDRSATGDRLTVSLWLARHPGQSRRPAAATATGVLERME
ncbi:MAG TPA: metalloregulator ArsR/SmtB family transcription factor [Hyphomicrobiaceae bacterium]|nr:metalloregulator ArsR/SmtB family transcription factor [Hyphomicrobiaceae bacterium]